MKYKRWKGKRLEGLWDKSMRMKYGKWQITTGNNIKKKKENGYFLWTRQTRNKNLQVPTETENTIFGLKKQKYIKYLQITEDGIEKRLPLTNKLQQREKMKEIRAEGKEKERNN